MRRPLAGACLVVALFLLWTAPATGATTPRQAPALMNGLSRLTEKLALLGQTPSDLGLFRRRALLELRFENRDGYRFEVVGFEQTVALSVTRGRFRSGRASSAVYLAHGKVTPTSIDASFDGLGRIAVRFRYADRKLRSTRKAGCRRPTNRVIAYFGVFAGGLRFRGEGGYTSARVHRVRGRLVDFAALAACLYGLGPERRAALPPPSAPLGFHAPGLLPVRRGEATGTPGVRTHPSTGPKATTLLASKVAPLARTVFVARAPDNGRVRFLALDEASRGSLGIARLVVAGGPPAVFDFNRALLGAATKPPLPFTGKAVFERGPRGAKSWTGPLAVSFLGAPRTPLTGAPFNSWLGRTW